MRRQKPEREGADCLEPFVVFVGTTSQSSEVDPLTLLGVARTAREVVNHGLYGSVWLTVC